MFRAVSPDASCDLIIVKGSVVKRVEVRTAPVSPSGAIYRNKSARDAGRQDIFAWVAPTYVEYEPPFPIGTIE